MWQVVPESKIQWVSCELHWKTYLPYMHISSVISFDLYCFLTYYLFLSICTYKFWLFCVLANFLIQSVRFWTIYDEMIIQSTTKARIWFPTVTFSTLIIRVAWIEGWFLMALILSMLINAFSVGCEPPQWLHLDREKELSLCIFYLIVQIQIINFKSDVDNDFWSMIFLLSSIFLGGLLSEHSIFHLAGNLWESVYKLIVRVTI